MIVYVETNFVLEIVLAQEHHISAEAILYYGGNAKIGTGVSKLYTQWSFYSVGRAIETDLQSLEEARRYQELFALSFPDSIIYATIINDLKKRPESEEKRFLSRDTKAFSAPRVKDYLKGYKCSYFPNFENALGNIKALLDKEDI